LGNNPEGSVSQYAAVKHSLGYTDFSVRPSSWRRLRVSLFFDFDVSHDWGYILAFLGQIAPPLYSIHGFR
jgi:hypothetical protein